MQNTTTEGSTTLCPSARVEVENSTVFGIISGTVEEPRVTYLKNPLPVTDEIITLSEPVTPTEVFRIAAPCAQNGCQHFDGRNCGLATRVSQNLPEAVESLPLCSIRRDCRWWQQEGKTACMRCPQVVTDHYTPSEIMRKVAAPAVISSQ